MDPPTFLVRPTGQPFSLAAALRGTVSTPKSKAKSSSKGWHFEIHEDTQDDEMANLMEHSTHTLDISDDEGRSSPTKGDRCNKENIAPADYHTTTNSPARRDLMTEDVRSPLADLATKEFYAEGCDASSVVIIPSEEEECDDKNTKKSPCSPTRPCANAATEGHPDGEPLVAEMDAKTPSASGADADTAAGFQIWESESAQDEAEAIEHATVTAGKQCI